MKKRVIAALTACCLLLSAGCDTHTQEDTNTDNRYNPYAEVTELKSGIAWPDGQALPTFATPAETMDAISVTHYTDDELLAVTALQGIVNKEQPRIFLFDNNPDEGDHTWAQTKIVGIDLNEYQKADKYDLIAKYAKEVKGAVLYDTSKSNHYRNLASTVAGLEELLPVTQTVLNALEKKGIALKVKVDLTELEYETPEEIYGYLYDNYWDDCNRRLIVSASPGDCQHVRDMAAATGSAVVYLDCTKDSQKAVFEKFLGDMTPGNGIVLGWFTTERSGITTVTAFGLSTIPADLYINSTVYAGTNHTIAIPDVPDKPELENKMYVALYISDGDNIQYNQRYMRKLWDQSRRYRGKVALNWTISPALADAGPALMNYFYTTATDLDCFVSGPSGLGYSMPINTLKEPGAPAINYLEGKDEEFSAFVDFTETYLQRTGLRVVTVWDNLSESQRRIYAERARHLYGLTVHDWFMGSNAASTVENGDMLVQQLTPCYSGNIDDVKNRLISTFSKWDKSSPAFFSAQFSVWGSAKPANILDLAEELESLYPGQIEFVRADHYFALYNEANGLPYDLTLSSKLTATATSNEAAASLTTDGTPYGESIWVADSKGEQTLTYDLGGSYEISRFVIRHAGDNGLETKLNTHSFRVEVSTDGSTWTTAYDYLDNARNVTDIDLASPVQASHLRIVITDPGADNIARIADVEIYGAVK